MIEMDIVYGKRGTGKTSQLIKISSDTGVPIVCVDRLHLNQVIDMSKCLDTHIPKPALAVELNRYKNGRATQYYPQIIIDDLEHFILGLTGCTAIACSINSTGKVLVPTIRISDDRIIDF